MALACTRHTIKKYPLQRWADLKTNKLRSIEPSSRLSSDYVTEACGERIKPQDFNHIVELPLAELATMILTEKFRNLDK